MVFPLNMNIHLCEKVLVKKKKIHIFTTQYQLQPTDFISELYEHITHVSAISHNLPISKVTADRKKT